MLITKQHLKEQGWTPSMIKLLGPAHFKVQVAGLRGAKGKQSAWIAAHVYEVTKSARWQGLNKWRKVG